MFMIKDMNDNFIPSQERPAFLAEASYYLARAIYDLAQAGGIPPEEKKKAGEEAISLARQALELRTRLDGTESARIAGITAILADILDYFNDVDDDEVLRLYEQSIAIIRRVEGVSSPNMASSENHLGTAYRNRARRAYDADDWDQEIANLESSLPHFVEAVRIYSAINHVDSLEITRNNVVVTEENLRRARAQSARK